jgi:hypothetical protein
MKIRPGGAELFHPDRRSDGQADRYDEANIADFRKFGNAPKKMVYLSL